MKMQTKSLFLNNYLFASKQVGSYSSFSQQGGVGGLFLKKIIVIKQTIVINIASTTMRL